MADQGPRGVGVYDRPDSADRPPYWVIVLLILIMIAAGIVTYLVWPM